VKTKKKGQTIVVRKGATRRVLGFRVTEEPGEIGGNGNRTGKKKVILRRSWQHKEREGDANRIKKGRGNGRTRIIKSEN
jgi:hypothetical protein